MKIIECERWRDVVGYEGWFEVSDHGRVRTCDARLADGRRRREVLPKPNDNGHLAVRLCGPWGHKWVFVHRLVLEAFVGPCPAGQEGAHGDGVPSNNRLTNLRWDTKKGNAADRKLHGTEQIGEKNKRSKLSADDVTKMRALRASGMRLRDIAARFGVTTQNVCHVVNGATWAHVGGRT